MKITLVAAIASNNVIGKENSLPWNIPEDLKRFKQMTSGHTILMGRKTFDSIGRPLPNRQNIVMTKDKNFEQEGIKVINDFDEALELIKESNEDVFVIGGSKIYELFEPVANSLAITRILKDFEGDAFFPDINWDLWQIEKEEKFFDEKSNVECKLIEYSKKLSFIISLLCSLSSPRLSILIPSTGTFSATFFSSLKVLAFLAIKVEF